MVKIKKKILLLLLGALLLSFSSFSFAIDRTAMLLSQGREEMEIVVGDIEAIWTRDLTRISITRPEIADALEADSSKVLMIGKAVGYTDVIIWDRHGKRSVRVWVFEETLDLAEKRIKELLSNANLNHISLERNDLEGKIVLSGEIEEKDKRDFDFLINPFASSVINLVKENQKKELVEIDVEIFEISASYAQQMGITWANAQDAGTQSFSERPGTIPQQISKFSDIFKIGRMGRTTLLTATIDALIEEGKAKVLSKPKIVVKSGEEASFNVGGQIPVQTTTYVGENPVSSFIFRDYGVDVRVRPMVEMDGKIDIDLNINVTDIDADQDAVDGTVGYTRRAVQTKLYLDDGQTIILAGFIKDNKAETIKRVPLLGSIPVIGALFRSKQISPDKQIELFITLTPRVIAGKRDQVEFVKDRAKEKSLLRPTAKPAFLKEQLTQIHEPQYLAPQRPTVHSSAAVPAQIASYARKMQEKIAGDIVYPFDAKKMKQEGIVSLDLLIFKDGSLVAVSIRESSGHFLLDQAALETVRKTSPYGEFPIEIDTQQMTLTIPIVYQLD